MILADKIINLRKKSGLSQEELADKIGVSRQAVSKWESAQSIPDLDKILLMSKLFGVSTDFLLKDEMEIEDTVEVDEDEDTKKKVTMEMANDFIDKKTKTAPKIAIGVALCILSPITLILLSGLSEVKGYNENLMEGIGLITLFVLVAIAITLFITSGNKVSEYEFLQTELFETAYGVTGVVKDKKKKFQDTYSKYTVMGIIICVLSVIPLFIGMFSDNDLYAVIGLVVMLAVVAIGVFSIVIVGCKMSPLVMLLQEGDYSKTKKTRGKLMSAISSCYWCVITAIYLIWSFTSKSWDKTWIIWAVAGVLFGGFCVIFDAIKANNKNK